MRNGNACVSRYRDSRGYARHDFKGHARPGQRLRLFAAASEDKGVSALEPHHGLPQPGAAHHLGGDSLLSAGLAVRRFPYEDHLRFLRRKAEDTLINQPVVEHDVRARAGVPTRAMSADRGLLGPLPPDTRRTRPGGLHPNPPAALTASMAPFKSSSRYASRATASGSAALPDAETLNNRFPELSAASMALRVKV